jgi:hypothetical protein
MRSADDNDQRILAQQQLLKIDDLAISMFTPCGARMTDEPVESKRVRHVWQIWL